MTRAIGSVRISELTDTTTSPERQRIELERWAAAQGVELLRIEEDLDLSAYSGVKRPGLERALAAIEAGEAEVLVVWRLDRLARSIVTFHAVLGRLEAAGASLVSVSESLDFRTPMGRAMASIIATFAELESATIASRVKAAQEHLRGQGAWPGGRRPFGWEPRRGPGGALRLHLHPEEAPVLQEAVQRALEGEPLAAIAQDFRERGLVTAYGRPWRRTTLRKVLLRPGLYGADGSEPLVDRATWAKLQETLRAREPGPRASTPEPPVLLDGLVYCGACGSRMRRTWVSRRGHFRLVCSQVPDGPCRVGAVYHGVAEEVERQVLDAYGHLAAVTPSEGEVVDPAFEERAQLLQAQADLQEDRYLRGLFPGEDGAERYAALAQAIQERLDILPSPYHLEPEGPTVPLGVPFRGAWMEASEETRAAWLRSMVGRVEVMPSTSGTRWEPERVVVRFSGA